MRKLVAWNLMTLDGYFEGEKPWDLEFHNHAWGPELRELSEQFGKEGDLLVFGRRTYEGMAAYWPTAENEGPVKDYMNSIAKLAVSKTMKEATWNNSRVVSDPVAELKTLKAQDGKTIFVFGSAELIASLMKEGLIDEYRICIVPVLLGSGNPLFKTADQVTELKLVSSATAANGAVILHYEIGKAA
ncbi:dihydrofolate reductase family protein [Neorhizobium sp. CSC1952]|uniref:dihydrofolate reductase family protein n=1 Tax=Neorhizobium sp. CSC1952 TaxID=2978974 RepID=UPI0025A5E6F3|nr:dihydrofolate reductase family protein [Rhizobium sp. CSC1952]WJR68192.1 dihydrofolate reductase family protein [Rhizobium sp. CSC1952]